MSREGIYITQSRKSHNLGSTRSTPTDHVFFNCLKIHVTSLALAPVFICRYHLDRESKRKEGPKVTLPPVGQKPLVRAREFRDVIELYAPGQQGLAHDAGLRHCYPSVDCLPLAPASLNTVHLIIGLLWRG